MKKLGLLLLALCLLLTCTACGADNVSRAAENGFDTIIAADKLSGGNASGKIGYQLEMPKEGEEIAVMVTSMGTVKIRLFPAAAPKAVYNFKALAETGYYDGITFHRVINDFMIQGGDPTGTGMGGESIWGSDFEDEFNKNLLNIRGSLAMANAGPNTNGSQFFINQMDADAFTWDKHKDNFARYSQAPQYYDMMGYSLVDMNKITKEVKSLYTKYGGNPTLDGAYSTSGKGHTVFGQVFEGMDVVDEIAAVATNANNKPLEDVIIESLRIEKYQG